MNLQNFQIPARERLILVPVFLILLAIPNRNSMRILVLLPAWLVDSAMIFSYQNNTAEFQNKPFETYANFDDVSNELSRIRDWFNCTFIVSIFSMKIHV